jgi:predicted homoserine dehydrogenase-like protein
MAEQSPRAGRPIRVGIIGAGAMGKGLCYQCGITPGIQCVALADLHLSRATECAEWLKRDYRVVQTAAAAEAVAGQGRLAVCADGDLVARCGSVDVVIEATSAIGAGGRFAESALMRGTHVVMMNAEADLIFGPYLLDLARRSGATYTSCDGDQHGVIKHLVDDLRLWGFELVMAGNIKGFLDRYSDPEKIVPEADKRRLDHRMAAAYTDGTKLNIEMALVANALGMTTRVPGMYGPAAARVHDVFDLFDFERLWADRQPFVDYILGAEPGGGVFAIGYCEDDYQRFMLSYYKMGLGPFYLFYRPYHLCHVEAMACVRDAAEGRSLLQPDAGLRTNVYAYAKRDLRRGETLDGIGGFTCYGLIENVPGATGLPICLADQAVLRRDVPKDGRIAWSDVTLDPAREDVRLYARALECGRVCVP